MTEKQTGWLRDGGIDFIIAACVFVVAYFVLDHQPADRFHIDEAHKISESHYFHLFFRTGELKHPDWREDFYARINPPIAKYLLGAALSLQGEVVTDGHLQDAFERLWQTPDELRQEVPASLLAASRRGTAMFAAACCVVIYGIGRLLAGRLAGLIAAGLLLAHPMYIQYCSLALTDSLLLFFLSAIVLLLICILRQTPQAGLATDVWRRTSLWRILILETLLPTLILLCAAGTKLNGGLASVLWIAAIGFGGWSRSSGPLAGQILRVARLSLLPPLLAVGLFVALNPSLYGDPLQRLLAMPQVYGDWMVKQAIDPGESITSFSRKWAETYFHTAVRGEMPLRKVSPALPFCGLMWFVLIGVGSVLQGRVATMRGTIADRSWLVVGWWVAIYGIGIIGWIPVDWDRYFLPLIPLQAVLASVGVCQLGRGVRLFFCVLIKHSGDRDAVSELRGTAAISGVALAAALGLAAVTDFSLISPRTLQANGVSSQLVRAAVQRGAEKHPQDPVRLMHYAEFLESIGVPEAALPFAKRAVSHFPPGEAPLPLESLHAAFEFKLASLEAQTGQMDTAREDLSKSNLRIQGILSRLKTNDPKVEQEFQQLLNQRTELAHQLDQKRKQSNSP